MSKFRIYLILGLLFSIGCHSANLPKVGNTKYSDTIGLPINQKEFDQLVKKSVRIMKREDSLSILSVEEYLIIIRIANTFLKNHMLEENKLYRELYNLYHHKHFITYRLSLMFYGPFAETVTSEM